MPAQKAGAKCCRAICVCRSLTKLVLSCSKQGYFYAGQWLGTLERACRYVQPIGSRHGRKCDVCHHDPMSGDRLVEIAPKDILFIACGNSRKLLVRHRIGGIFRDHKIGTGLLRFDNAGQRKRSLDCAIVVTDDFHRTGPDQRRRLFHKFSQLVTLQSAILDRITLRVVIA